MSKSLKTRIIVIAAPSGAGKSSFIEKICKEEPRLFDTVTYTTRKMRQGESQGFPYHFITTEEFEKKISEKFFIEWARVHTNLYGTSMIQLEEAWAQGKTVIMDVDVQGADTFKAHFPDCQRIFIKPPSIEELRRRITKRDGGIPQDIEVRMANATKEIARANEYDFQIVNDNFEESYQVFKKIIEDLLG